MKTFIVVVNVDAPEGSAAAAEIHQGFGEEYVVAYLRRKMPAGSPFFIETAHELGVEMTLSDSEETVLIEGRFTRPVKPHLRDDDPAV